MPLNYFKNQLQRKVHPLNFLIVGMIAILLTGAFLLWLPFMHEEGKQVTPVNALFTATSAITVTGLVVLDTADNFNFYGELVILLLIVIGGLGYMVIISFLLLRHNPLNMQHALLMKESLSLPSLGDIFLLARRVVVTILAFWLLGISILFWFWHDLGWKGLWYGVFHTLSAFNNAGFDLVGGFASLIPYANSIILNLTIMALIFLGGIGFLVISDVLAILKSLRQRFSLHSKIVLTTSIFLILFGAVSFYALEKEGVLQGKSTSESWLTSFFQSVSARTAGFATVNIDSLSIPTLLLICVLMFIGASPGGTGSGIKTTTLAVIILFVVAAFKNKDCPEAFGRRIARESVERGMLLFLLSCMTVTFFIILLSILEPFSLVKIIFEVVSAFGTVGLSTGITPSLTAGSKLALVLLMFIGRLTPLTLLVWLSEKRKSNVHLLEEPIIIG
ncbi:hypothetical protein HYX12_04610 [Candidatus Woesearchaeota archaeon]|nr:hypothetical protein [Candidatus Woesearchaeota archaeon]